MNKERKGGVKRTRQAAEEEERTPADGTRKKTKLAADGRQAMNRSQIVEVDDDPRQLAADKKMSAREVRPEDGWVRYGAISNWRRAGVQALLGPKMLAKGGSSANIDISGTGPGLARGHLLAKSLGGDGRDARNLVACAHEFTNLQQFQQVEKPTLEHVLRTNTREQKAHFGRRLWLSESRKAVSQAAHQKLLSSGYYHIVRFEVVLRYPENECIYPASVEYRGTCETCRETVFKTTTIRNSIRSRR